MPITDDNGNVIPTWDDIRRLIGAIPAWWDAVTSGNPIDLFEFLFGGGHAGSCGAFREQYFGVKAVLDPILDQANRLWGNAGIQASPTPTEIMATFGSTLGTAINVADSQFDQFKGSNLLGQTMFASRFHLYLERRWIADAIFGSAQYFQERNLNFAYFQGFQDNEIIDLYHQLNAAQLQLNGLGGDHQAILNLQASLNVSWQVLGDITGGWIPAFQNILGNQSAQIQVLLDRSAGEALRTNTLITAALQTQVFPKLAITSQQVLEIGNQITNTINPEIAVIFGNLQTYNTQTLPQIFQQLDQLQQEIPQVLEIPNLQQQQAQQQQHILQIEQQKVSVILPQLGQLWQTLGDVINQLQNDIRPKQGAQQQQITNLQTYITNIIDQEITTLNNEFLTINNTINTFVDPNIFTFQQFIQNFQTTIINILKANCQLFFDCIKDKLPKEITDFCDFGKRAWGIMAECWLSTHTPTDPIIIDYDPVFFSIQGFLADFTDVANPQASPKANDEMWYDVTREQFVLGLSNVAPGEVIGVGFEGAPFIFQEPV
jgi:hypothetical protein